MRAAWDVDRAARASGLSSPRRPAPAPARPRHLEVVRGRPAPGRRPPRARLLLVLLAVGALLFGLVTVNVLLGQGSFVEKGLEERAHELDLKLQRLELQVARARTPAQIASRASRLGLAPATNVEVLVRPSPGGNRSQRNPG
jgi:hypothetical protein